MRDEKIREQLITEFVKGSSRRNRILWGDIDEAFDLNITTAQREALIAIATIKDCHISDIANWLGVTNGAVTQLVDGLQNSGVVERMADPHDARKVRVVITTHGREKLREGMKYFVSHVSKIFENTSTQELQGLINLQNTILSYEEK